LAELERFSRNSFFLAVSYLLRIGAGILVTILVGRNVSQDDFGRLALALTISTFFGVAADFGLPALTVRDIARDPSVASVYYRSIFTLKAILSLIGFAGVVVFMRVMHYPPEVCRVVYPISAFAFVASLGTYHYFVFRGLERMQFETVAAVIHNVTLIACVGGAVVLSRTAGDVPINRVTMGYLVAGLVSTGLIIALFSGRLGGLSLRVDPAFWRVLLGRAGLFALYGFLGLIYMQIDTVMLSKLRADPNSEIAIYQAPVKLLSAAMFVVGILINVFLPMLTRRYQGPLEDFRALVHTLNRIGITIVAPIVVFSFAFSRELMTTLFRAEYAASAPILMILSVGFLVWNGPPYAAVFVAMGKESINFYVSAVCAAANVLLNLVFIPRYGPIAAASTTLATYVLMKALYSHYCVRYLGSVFINARYAAALGLCVVLAYGLRMLGMHVLAAAAVFAALYASASYLLVLSSAEKELIGKLAATVIGREAAA